MSAFYGYHNVTELASTFNANHFVYIFQHFFERFKQGRLLTEQPVLCNRRTKKKKNYITGHYEIVLCFRRHASNLISSAWI